MFVLSLVSVIGFSLSQAAETQECRDYTIDSSSYPSIPSSDIHVVASSYDFSSRADCVDMLNQVPYVEEGWDVNSGVIYYCIFSEDEQYTFDSSNRYIVKFYEPGRIKAASSQLMTPGTYYGTNSRELNKILIKHQMDTCYNSNDYFFIEISDLSGNLVSRSNNFIIKNPTISITDIVFLTSQPTSPSDCTSENGIDISNGISFNYINNVLQQSYDTIYACSAYNYVPYSSTVSVTSTLNEVQLEQSGSNTANRGRTQVSRNYKDVYFYSEINVNTLLNMENNGQNVYNVFVTAAFTNDYFEDISKTATIQVTINEN